MKKCLIVCSEPFFWDEYLNILTENGFKFEICLSAEKTAEALKRESFDFAMVSNCLEGMLPSKGEFAQPKIGDKHDFYSVGETYVVPMLEKYKIPFVLLCTARQPSGKKYLHCLYAGDVFNFDLFHLNKILKTLAYKT